MQTYRDASDRRKRTQRVAEFRAMTADEARNLTGTFQFVGKDRMIREARVSGSLKTWKREPARFRLPVKYGLYESGALVDALDQKFAAFEDAPISVIPAVQVTEWRDEPIAE